MNEGNDLMKGYYGKKNYVSIWFGKCENREIVEEYIEKDYSLVDLDDVALFKMGEDFEIMSYNEDFSMISVYDKYTNNVEKLLKDKYCDDAIESLKKIYNNGLPEEYNTCIVFVHMKYDGHIEHIVNNLYGEYTFYGTFQNDYFRY